MSPSLTAVAQCDTMAHMSLLRGLFWVALFIFFAFCFTVLFEYGTADFSAGFKKEGAKVKAYVMELTHPAKKDDKEKK